MFIDTFKSFSLTFYCFYSVTHHFSTFHKGQNAKDSIHRSGTLQVIDYQQTGEEKFFLLLLIISDGGKLELWDLETGATVRSVRGHDEDAVTAVKVTMVTSNSV